MGLNVQFDFKQFQLFRAARRISCAILNQQNIYCLEMDAFPKNSNDFDPSD